MFFTLSTPLLKEGLSLLPLYDHLLPEPTYPEPFYSQVDLIYFDTTSTYFEVEEKEEEEGLRRYGHSRDRRPDLPQAVIGLAVTRTGIPVRCWVWTGSLAR